MNTVSAAPSQVKFSAVSFWTRVSDLLANHEKKPTSSTETAPIKICLVKTTACRELYNLSTPCSLKKLILSANWRTGPMGLLQSLDGDMYIVNTVSDDESQVFTRREGFNSERRKLRIENQKRLSSYAVDVESVDWGRYDIVVAFENSVPSRVAREYSETTFVSMIEDHRSADYRKYRLKLPEGYKLFFNLRTGPSPHDFVKRPWEIDFTYGFREAGALTRLLPEIKKDDVIHLETHESSDTQSVLEKMTGMAAVKYKSNPNLDSDTNSKSYCELTRRAKFFVSLNPSRPLGGLAAIDAISADTLVIANRHRIWNAHPICPELHVTDAVSAGKLINLLNTNSSVYEDMIEKQRKLLQYYCYDRPLRQLLDSLEQA